MPIYEYRCPDCDHRFQRLLPMTSSDKGPACPRCGSERVERLVSSFASTSGSGGSSAGRSCGSAPT